MTASLTVGFFYVKKMTTYITQDENGHITASADWAFPGSLPADHPVLRGYDGKLYFKDELPVKPEPPLSEQKAAKKAALNDAFERLMAKAHCRSSLDFEIDANEKADRNIRQLLTVVKADETVSFCDYDNDYHQVTGAGLETLLADVACHTRLRYAEKWALRKAIDAARTSEELDGVVIPPVGWY